MVSDQQHLFKEGVRYMLETWPALHVAFGHADSSASLVASSHVAQNLQDEVVDYFEQHGDAILPEDMTQFFDDFLEDVLETALDDNSVEQMSEMLCALWGAAQEGDAKPILALKERYEKKIAQRQQTVVHPQSATGENSDSDSDATETGREEEAQKQTTTIIKEKKKPIKEEPVVDEDGFELVQRRR